MTTFTHSGGNLTRPRCRTQHLELWLASGGQLTQIKDPLSQRGHDQLRFRRSGRHDHRGPTATEEFTTTRSRAGPTAAHRAARRGDLLAQAAATYTSPNSNMTTIQPDWLGLGMTGNQIDALGDVADLRPELQRPGHVAVDQVNRVTSYAYDSSREYDRGDLSRRQHGIYTFNSDSEPLTFTDANGNTTSYTYSERQPHGRQGPDGEPDDDDLYVDGPGQDNRRMQTIIRRPICTIARTASRRPVPGRHDQPLYVQFPGQRDQVGRRPNNATTYSYDALNRETGTTDALNDSDDADVRLRRQPDRGPGANARRPDGPDHNVCL